MLFRPAIVATDTFVEREIEFKVSPDLTVYVERPVALFCVVGCEDELVDDAAEVLACAELETTSFWPG